MRRFLLSFRVPGSFGKHDLLRIDRVKLSKLRAYHVFFSIVLLAEYLELGRPVVLGLKISADRFYFLVAGLWAIVFLEVDL